MAPKIFITPWIRLFDEEIRFCIEAGANSARIHTGKLWQARINSLVEFYTKENFKFYIDLTGNKPRVNCFKHYTAKDEFKVGESLVIYTAKSMLPDFKREHDIELDFFPRILKTQQIGDLNVDDGKLAYEIVKVVIENKKINYILAKVINAKQNLVFQKDGVSSSNINIHSGELKVLTQSDLLILKHIPDHLKANVKFIALSFVENAKQLALAIGQIEKLGYHDFQVVPKIETVAGVKNIKKICEYLRLLYGLKAELQIGRGDLSQDCLRGDKKYDLTQQVDRIIKVAHENHVMVSVLALVLQSSRQKFYADRATKDLTPSDADRQYILHLCQQGVTQIGLTNDMYIDQPERIVRILQEIIASY